MPSTRRRSAVVRYAGAAALATAALVAAIWSLTPIGWYPDLIVAASLVTFGAYGWDKRSATRSTERVPERVLHGLALAGGFAGGWLGRAIFHHKTRKPSFGVVLALGTGLHAGLAVWMYSR